MLQPPRQTLDHAAWQRMAADPSPPLLGLWADAREVYALLRGDEAPTLVSTEVSGEGYPALSPMRPIAAQFERMVRDLWGHVAVGGIDQRPWCDHGRWPLRAPLAQRPQPAGRIGPYEFLFPDDLDQMPIGPVRGGVQSAVHLRLGVRGETVARLETRLGYTHKGTLALMRGKSPRAAARFAARLVGERTVAHSIAFACATESALGCSAPPRAVTLRAVMADIERLGGHLDVLSSIAEAAGFAILARDCALRLEAVRCAVGTAFGHRLMMDQVVPGGVAADIVSGGAALLGHSVQGVAETLKALRLLPVSRRLSDVGVVGEPMEGLHEAHAGDVASRARDHMDQLWEGVGALQARLGSMPDGPISVSLPAGSGEAVGNAGSAFGDIWHWIRLDHGQIANVFMRDPAWLRWPLLEAAATGSAADDLPLILASFGGSCSGVDL